MSWRACAARLWTRSGSAGLLARFYVLACTLPVVSPRGGRLRATELVLTLSSTTYFQRTQYRPGLAVGTAPALSEIESFCRPCIGSFVEARTELEAIWGRVWCFKSNRARAAIRRERDEE